MASTATTTNKVQLWLLPDDFFSLSNKDQWAAVTKVTTRATPLSSPRPACQIESYDDFIAVCFFLITLGLPMGIAVAFAACIWAGSSLGFALTVGITVLLSLHPIPGGDWRRSRLSLALIRYFSMEILVDTSDPTLAEFATSAVEDPAYIAEHLPLVCLACPHGVFNYGAIIWCCISRWFVGWEQFTAAAAVVKYVPGLRYMDQLIWAIDADRRSIKKVLQHRSSFGDELSPRHGGMLGIVPDGIQGAFRCKPGVDELVIGKKRGLMRICSEEGATVFAAWFFGTTDMLTVVQDPFGIMEYVSRRLQAGIMGYYGRWGLPIPRRVSVTLSCAAYKCKDKFASPTSEQVDEVHNNVYGGLQRVYDKQKSYAGYPDRTLIIS